jgi:hypothetical protein
MSTENKDEKKSVSKEKLRTIMEAASALTALGDEDSSGGSRAGSPVEKDGDAKKTTDATPTAEEKRFLPDYKKPDAALTFPEKVRPLSALHASTTALDRLEGGSLDDAFWMLRSHQQRDATTITPSNFCSALFDIFVV